MGYPLKQNQTAQPLMFLMIDSTDHLSGKTGLSPTVRLGKNGGTGAAPSGAVSEVDATNLPGWYKVAGNATDSNTLGPLVLRATGTGADPCDDRFDVVAYDPQTTSMGLSLAKGTNLTGLNDIAATAIVSGGAITTSSGAVSSVTTTGTATNLTNLPAIPTDWLTAAGVKADAVTKIQSGLATPTNITAGTITTVTNAVAVSDKTGFKLASDGLDAVVIETGLNARQALSIIAAGVAGETSGAGTSSIDISGAGVATVRISAATDSAGERTSVTLSPPS